MIIRSASSWSKLPAVAACTVLLCCVASGCCFFGGSAYDSRAAETWKELERGLHSGPTSVDAEQTGVSIQMPLVFDSKRTKSFRPGQIVDNEPVAPERVQPPGLTLPGLRFTSLVHYPDSQSRNLPVSCYLAVLPKGPAERAKAKQQLLEAAKALNANAAWNAATLPGNSLSAEKLTLTGVQKFLPAEQTRSDKAVDAEGQLDLYLVAGEHANVLVGFRAPVEIAERMSLFTAAEASVASIKSEPLAPVAAPAAPAEAT